MTDILIHLRQLIADLSTSKASQNQQETGGGPRQDLDKNQHDQLYQNRSHKRSTEVEVSMRQNLQKKSRPLPLQQQTLEPREVDQESSVKLIDPNEGWKYVDPNKGWKYVDPNKGWRFVDPNEGWKYVEPSQILKNIIRDKANGVDESIGGNKKTKA